MCLCHIWVCFEVSATAASQLLNDYIACSTSCTQHLYSNDSKDYALSHGELLLNHSARVHAQAVACGGRGRGCGCTSRGAQEGVFAALAVFMLVIRAYARGREAMLRSQERRASPLEAGGTLKGTDAAGKVSAPLRQPCVGPGCFAVMYFCKCITSVHGTDGPFCRDRPRWAEVCVGHQRVTPCAALT
jgi:hypothetical protein